MMFAKMDKRLKYGLILAVVLALALTVVALADDVVNNIDNTIDNDKEVKTLVSGGSTNIGFFISATSGGGDFANCNVDSDNPATLTITSPSGVNVNGPFQFTTCGEVKDFTFSSSTPGTYNFNPNAFNLTGGKSGSKWDTQTAQFTLNVTSASKKPTTTTVTCPTSVTYNGTAQTPCTATVTGDGLAQSLTVNYSNNTNAGTATASASFAENDNYLGSSDSKNFTIDKAPVTATAGSGSGTYNGLTQTPGACAVTGDYTGDLTCANNPSSVGPAAGTYPISPDVSGTGLSNFEVTAVNGSFTINKAPVTATAGGGSGTYNGSTQTPDACVVTGDYTGDLTCANDPASVGPAADTYTIVPVVSGSNQDNFTITLTNGSYTISQKAASVTPNAASKTYGDPDPALTGTLDGFLLADGVTATYSRTAGETVLGGPYTISATLSPTLVLSNYDITYNTADFTINAKAASVTPNAASKTYGEDDPAFTGTLSGFLAADNVTATYSRTAGETVAGSPYTISATLSPAGVLSNYDITYYTANFTINQRPITVTADSGQFKILGASDPVFTYEITSGSLVGSDALTGALTRVAGETVGEYDILIGTLTAGSNYNLTFVSAKFKILYATGGSCYGAPGHAILQPINTDGSSVFKQKSTVPAKFRVCDVNGNSIGTPGVVSSFQLYKTINGIGGEEINEPIVSTTPDTAFRWSSSDQQWIFNLNTKNLSAGRTYFYLITLNDGSNIEFSFGLK